MKTHSTGKKDICPFCGEQYSLPPALSRADGKTLICPDCGVREALTAVGVSAEEQNKIIDAIHTYYQKARNKEHALNP